jgi:hypothetical protein
MTDRCGYVYPSGNRCIFDTSNVHADLDHDYQAPNVVFDTLPPVNPGATMGTVSLDQLATDSGGAKPTRDGYYIAGVALCYMLGAACTFFTGIAVGSQMGW